MFERWKEKRQKKREERRQRKELRKEIKLLFSFEGHLKRSGDDGKMDTPVPIPNTEVKHLNGDNSYASHSEDNKLPGNDNLLFFG